MTLLAGRKYGRVVDITGTDRRHRRIVIVGDGFTCAALAVQLVRSTTVPIDITIIEPREQIGRGLTYSTRDPDHRLNGPLGIHTLDQSNPGELRRWWVENGLLERDPESIGPAGHIFLRRGDLGTFAREMVARHANDKRLGSQIRHVRDWAVSAARNGSAYRITTAGNREFDAQMLFIATGNATSALRAPFSPESLKHPSIVADPFEPGRLEAIDRAARVLVVGGGLTSLDVVSTLLRRKLTEPITVISRRGFRPCEQPPEILRITGSRDNADIATLDLNAPIPAFLRDEPPSILRWCRALRSEAKRIETEGGTWHKPFDDVRNVVWKLWPLLPAEEKRRFLRRLRLFYDVHRFRAPVMNDRIVRAAETDGKARFLAAALTSVDALSSEPVVRSEMTASRTKSISKQAFDVVVNCTGLDAASTHQTNPVLKSLCEQGMLRPHATGLGFEVAENSEAIDSDGSPQSNLRVFGPQSAGSFGDPVAIAFIVGRLHRLMPELVQAVASLPAGVSPADP